MLIDLVDLLNGDDDEYDSKYAWTKEALEGRLVIVEIIENDPGRVNKFSIGWLRARIIDGRTGKVLTDRFGAMGKLYESMSRIPVGGAAGGRIASSPTKGSSLKWRFDLATSAEDQRLIKIAYQLYEQKPPF